MPCYPSGNARTGHLDAGTSLGKAVAGSQAFSGRDVPGVGCWGEASFLLPAHLLPIRALPLQTQGIFLDRTDTVAAWETA